MDLIDKKVQISLIIYLVETGLKSGVFTGSFPHSTILPIAFFKVHSGVSLLVWEAWAHGDVDIWRRRSPASSTPLRLSSLLPSVSLDKGAFKIEK